MCKLVTIENSNGVKIEVADIKVEIIKKLYHWRMLVTKLIISMYLAQLWMKAVQTSRI